jgi:hypothetical protein
MSKRTGILYGSTVALSTSREINRIRELLTESSVSKLAFELAAIALNVKAL